MLKIREAPQMSFDAPFLAYGAPCTNTPRTKSSRLFAFSIGISPQPLWAWWERWAHNRTAHIVYFIDSIWSFRSEFFSLFFFCSPLGWQISIKLIFRMIYPLRCWSRLRLRWCTHTHTHRLPSFRYRAGPIAPWSQIKLKSGRTSPFRLILSYFTFGQRDFISIVIVVHRHWAAVVIIQRNAQVETTFHCHRDDNWRARELRTFYVQLDFGLARPRSGKSVEKGISPETMYKWDPFHVHKRTDGDVKCANESRRWIQRIANRHGRANGEKKCGNKMIVRCGQCSTLQLNASAVAGRLRLRCNAKYVVILEYTSTFADNYHCRIKPTCNAISESTDKKRAHIRCETQNSPLSRQACGIHFNGRGIDDSDERVNIFIICD